MKKKVLVSNIMMLKDVERFDRELRSLGYEPTFPDVDQFLSEAGLMKMVGEYDGWLAGDDQITRAVLKKALPRLKVIAKWGTGIDSIDLVAAKEYGVPVLNSPGAFRDAVAEVAIAYMLDLSRHVALIDRSIRAGNWPKLAGGGLIGKKLGIIGFGAIGQGVAERALGMKMQVIAHDAFYSSPLKEFPDVAMESFDAVLSDSDFVCLCCNMTSENVHLIDEAALKKMQPNAMLINVARGPLIEEKALVDALRNNNISGAGLDVFEKEPIELNNELIKFDNVILGSHNANNLISATEYVHENTLKNLKSILK